MEADSASVAAQSGTSNAPSAATSGPSSGSAAASSTCMVVAQARAPTGFFNCCKCKKTVGSRKYILQEIIKKHIFDIWHAVRTFSQKKFPRGSQTKSFSKQTKLEHENHEFWLQIAQSCKQRPSFFSQPTPPVVSSSFNAVVPTVQLQGKSTLLNSITLFLLRHVSTTEDDTSERFVEPAQCLCGLQCKLFSPCQAMVEAA